MSDEDTFGIAPDSDDAWAGEAYDEGLDENFDETSTSLFEGDQGTLTYEQRKTLVNVLKRRYIWAAEQPQDWQTLLDAREKITVALHNMFLDLHIDEQYLVAFKRQAQPEGDGRFPTLLHDVAYGREDTILLIFLRQRFSSERAAGRDTVTVDQKELTDAITQFRPAHATDHAGDKRRAEQAIERVRKAGLLAWTPDIVGEGFADDHPVVRKDIRALKPERAADYLRLSRPSMTVRVVEPPDLPKVVHAEKLIVPDDALMRELVETYGLGDRRKVDFDPVFLYWDREWSRSQRPADFDGAVTADELSRKHMGLAQALSSRSSDWWRQVGAVVVRGDDVVDEVWNHHLPTEYTPYIDGDPRNSFRRGVRADLSTAIHAEASIIARAARRSIALEGTDLYVTTFPCPACARLIVESGIKRCFFAGPYSILEGDQILRSAGIEIIWVDTSDQSADRCDH